ncbi:MAG: hypothetical protein IT179_02030 [Acidobacteria bacterium]|nr:hypothetical protein [Acidobacteriota bacterium]
MALRRRLRIVVVVGLLVAGVSSAGQGPALTDGTVTARIDGAPFSAVVSVASMADGDLVLSNLSNQVQLQVPRAKVGTFGLTLDADGGLVDLVLTLRTKPKRFVTPVSGSVTIEVLDAKQASERFAFTGKDLATDQPVTVTDGRFQVALIPKPRRTA